MEADENKIENVPFCSLMLDPEFRHRKNFGSGFWLDPGGQVGNLSWSCIYMRLSKYHHPYQRIRGKEGYTPHLQGHHCPELGHHMQMCSCPCTELPGGESGAWNPPHAVHATPCPDLTGVAFSNLHTHYWWSYLHAMQWKLTGINYIYKFLD